MLKALKGLFIALAAQVPLLGVFWHFWSQIQERPVIAALLAVVYEVFVLVLAFGKKVWEELEKDAIKATADWVREWVRGFAPGFRRRYKQQVSSEHGIFNVRGLGLVNTYTLNLDQVFIELRIDPSNPQKFNLDPIVQREFAGNRPIWDFLRLEKSRTEEAFALAVIGPPGSGKTTLLQNIALTFAKNRQRRYRMRAFTPVFLFLRDHTQIITQAEPPPLAKLVQDYFNKKREFDVRFGALKSKTYKTIKIMV